MRSLWRLDMGDLGAVLDCAEPLPQCSEDQ
jgi:hypothetical protein